MITLIYAKFNSFEKENTIKSIITDAVRQNNLKGFLIFDLLHAKSTDINIKQNQIIREAAKVSV